MRNVVVTGCPRADLAAVDELASFGVATVHDPTSATLMRKSAGAVDGFQGPAKFLRGAAALMVCGPRRGGNVTIRSLRLVLALTETGGRAALQGAVREAADLRQPAAAVRPGD